MTLYENRIDSRKVMLSVFMVAVLLFGQVQTAFASDQSHNHTFPNDTLAQLIEVRDDDDDYDVEEAQAMIERIGAIPEIILQKLVSENLTLTFMDYPLTQLPEYEDLAGVVPRGWEDTGLTWDDVPGAGGSNAAARIGYSDYGSGHSTINLELHEISHSIDNFLDTASNRISETEEFQAIHTAEKESMFPGNTYFDYLEEYFAESMAYYYLGSDSRAELQQHAPQTYEFIASLSLRVLQLDRTENSVDLLWEAVPSAESYEIYRVGMEDGPIATTTETTYQDTDGIEKLNSYIYYVVALDGAGEQVNRTYEAWAYSMAPDPPQNFEVIVNDNNTVTLSWDEVENAVEYFLTREGEEIGRTTDVTFTDDTALEPGRYGYGIWLINDLDESSGSYVRYITIEADEPDEPVQEQPEAPENVVATLENYQTVTLSWEEVANADYYTIYRDNEEIGTTTELSYTDSGLSTETEYAYYVEAVNEVGSAAGDVVNVTTGTAPDVPDTPQNVEATLADYQTVTLSWDSVESANAYTISRYGEVITTTTDTSYTDRGLNEATLYTYTIEAVNEAGSSEGISAEIRTGTAPIEPEEPIVERPNQPENLVADLASYNSVSLAWDVVENADLYTIFRNGEEIDTISETSYTDSDLSENTTYTYTVQAVNEAGSSVGAVIEITTRTEPEEPQEPEEPRDPEIPKDPTEEEETDNGESEKVPNQVVTIEEESTVEVVTADNDEDRNLPATATNNYTLLLLGVTFMTLGTLLFIHRKKKQLIK